MTHYCLNMGGRLDTNADIPYKYGSYVTACTIFPRKSCRTLNYRCPRNHATFHWMGPNKWCPRNDAAHFSGWIPINGTLEMTPHGYRVDQVYVLVMWIRSGSTTRAILKYNQAIVNSKLPLSVFSRSRASLCFYLSVVFCIWTGRRRWSGPV